MPVSVWWKGLQTTFTLAGRLLGLVRRIPIVDEVIDRAQRTLLNPVVVKLVRDADDPDLDTALELYKKRIPDDQRFEVEDIVRWLREDRENRKKNASGPSDWFIVAKLRHRVCGFILFHYYPSTNLALFAYMVAANAPGTHFNTISRSLCTYVSGLLKRKRELHGYRGFVLEVEDPRRERSARKRDEALARVRRFCTLAEMQGFSLRAFDFDYKQPKLSIENPASAELPMLLLSARTRQTDGEPKSLRGELEEVLGFVYTQVYPEGYSPDPDENRLYREYCETLLKRELAGLPIAIRALSSSQLAAQVGKKKSANVPSDKC